MQAQCCSLEGSTYREIALLSAGSTSAPGLADFCKGKADKGSLQPTSLRIGLLFLFPGSDLPSLAWLTAITTCASPTKPFSSWLHWYLYPILLASLLLHLALSFVLLLFSAQSLSLSHLSGIKSNICLPRVVRVFVRWFPSLRLDVQKRLDLYLNRRN